jgi:hypothetical protein
MSLLIKLFVVTTIFILVPLRLSEVLVAMVPYESEMLL